MEDEIGRPLNEIDPASFDDSLLHKVVGNPLHVFKFIHRAHHHLEQIVSEVSARIKDEHTAFFLASVMELRKTGPWPDMNDLTGVTISLCRVLSTYQLNAMDFTKGVIGDLESKARLNIEELHFIAMNRLHAGVPLRPWAGPEYALAREFMEVAYQ